MCDAGQGTGDHAVPSGFTPETSGRHGEGGGHTQRCVSRSHNLFLWSPTAHVTSL